ncbi:hypothetical protein DFQ14_101430 [Halopolyspora algeriensis]|uniref:Uncharacterized protein n=1 Tax=Halopolyspora algeriensis TaxID=1500506 RepID=A0A368VY09_9ACTN|nr:hypothetical protein [Halopolyspora algeriensis]RCW47086.1 hypothetical protein DFQ14_101430 [Halopolyspora algeriensis]TQM48173.1 hypothetical protein FHU43_3135 [Halopolyspora algeriensis]
MSDPTGDDPERQLSSALRAQAAGNTGPGAEAGATSSGGAPPPRPARLPVLRLLLSALVLGLVAGALAGIVSLL